MLQSIIVSEFQKVDVLKEEINFNNLQLTVLQSRMENLDSAIVTLVQKMKDIVFLMMTAWMVFHVDQSIANTWMALKVMWSVVTIQHQVMKISVLPKIFVKKMKGTVILILNALETYFVDITIALMKFGLTMKQIVVRVVKQSLQIFLTHIQIIYMRHG